MLLLIIGMERDAERPGVFYNTSQGGRFQGRAMLQRCLKVLRITTNAIESQPMPIYSQQLLGVADCYKIRVKLLS
eukprot:1159343-Pelagomonas_calceolata.AAC.6